MTIVSGEYTSKFARVDGVMKSKNVPIMIVVNDANKRNDSVSAVLGEM